MKKGRAGTITHDYKRHGVTTLFAALDVLEGKVIGQCMKRHRHQEFIRFLNVIDAKVPKMKAVHILVHNHATHKLPRFLNGSKTIPGSCSTSLRHRPPGSTPLRASLPSSPKSALSAACSDPSKNSKTPSTAPSTTPTQTQSPLPGPRTPTKSSPPSNEGTKC